MVSGNVQVYALLLKLFACFNFFRIRGELQRDAFELLIIADVARKSVGETPSSTSSASVLISIFCNQNSFYGALNVSDSLTR